MQFRRSPGDVQIRGDRLAHRATKNTYRLIAFTIDRSIRW
jgi:hypothetical protein